MKTILTFIFIVLSIFNLSAQDNIFILVDVSKSVSQSELANAKQLVNDILNGNNSGSTSFSINSPTPTFNFASGGFITIMHFGEKNTVTNSNPTVHKINNINEVSSIINSEFRTNPTDNRTYLTLAKAKCADIAYQNSLKEYFIILVSDNVSDDFGGSTTSYSNTEQNLVNRLNSITTSFAGSLFIYNNRNAFTVLFQRINLSGYGGQTDSDGDGVPDLIDNCPNTPKGTKVDQYGCADTTPPQLKIEFTTHKDGTIAKPKEIKSDKFTISWSCQGAPSTAKYKVRLSPLKIQGAKTQVFTTAGNSYNLSNLTDGKYRITVSSAQPNLNASSSSTIIEVKTNSSLAFLWVILLLVAVGSGYWYWNKKRNEKMETAQKTNDIFSSNGNDNSSYEDF